MSKGGYEPVADVETGVDAAHDNNSSQYADLSPDQVALVQKMDNAIRTADYQFAMPEVVPSELKTEGSFLSSLTKPTLALILVAGAGAVLNDQKEKYPFLEVIVAYYPYASAILMYLASVSPMYFRFQSAMAPLFAKVEQVENKVQDEVANISFQVDSQVSAIEQQLNKSMVPIIPILNNASRQATHLKKVDPRLDIPDASDFTREFNNMRETVSTKVANAQSNISIERVIPGTLRSFRALFWRIIFPVLIIGLVFQLGVAWVCKEYVIKPSGFGPADTSPARRLRGSSRRIPSFERGQVLLEVSFETHSPSETNVSGAQEKSRTTKHSPFMRRLDESVINKIESDVVSAMEAAETEIQSDVKKDKPLGISALVSYLMALAQLCALYIFTSPPAQAFKMNQLLKAVSDKTNQTLREYGVTMCVQEVMGTRMARIRTKVLKIFRSVDKIQDALAKLPSAGNAKEKLETLGQIGKKKKKSLLGKLFG